LRAIAHRSLMNAAGSSSKLVSEILFRGSSDVLNALIALTIIALVARQLSAAHYGIYTQIMTTASLLMPLLTLRLNTACVRFFPSIASDVDVRRQHFTTATLVIISLSLIAFALLTLTPNWSARVIFGTAVNLKIIVLLGAYLALRSVVTLFTDYFRAMNRSTLASIYNSARFVLTLAALVAALLADCALDGILIAYLCAETTMMLVLGSHLVGERSLGFVREWNLVALRPYLAYSLPLLPYSMFLTVNQFADRYFITHLIGLEATGVYGFSYGLIMSAFLLNASISYVIYPHLTRLWEDGDMQGVQARLESGQRLFVFVAVPVAFGFCTIYPALVTAMVGEEFVISPLAVAAIVAGQFWLGLCSIFGFIIDLSKRTTFFVKVLVVTATLNLILNALLVPRLGIAGAALATAFTYATQLFMMWFATREIAPFKVRIDVGFMARCTLLASVMAAAVFALQPLAGAADIIIAIGVATSVYFAGALIMFRNRLGELRHWLRGR